MVGWRQRARPPARRRVSQAGDRLAPDEHKARGDDAGLRGSARGRGRTPEQQPIISPVRRWPAAS
eukprot:199592-Pleurochrysis_carterae.AAC.4